MAADLGVRKIAFPSISTGVYGFPIERAAGIAVRELRAGPVLAVRVWAFGHDVERALRAALSQAPE